jgi:hypothetical protein
METMIENLEIFYEKNRNDQNIEEAKHIEKWNIQNVPQSYGKTLG